MGQWMGWFHAGEGAEMWSSKRRMSSSNSHGARLSEQSYQPCRSVDDNRMAMDIAAANGELSIAV